MLEETREAHAAVRRQLAHDAALYATLGADLRNAPPRSLVTIARGSSDHAASYVGYLVMARLGVLVTSLPMSLITLYPPRLATEGLLALAFSQSGQSPDVVDPTRFFRAHSARTVALVNDAASPLASAAQWVLPLRAGPERSIAATKSCIAQMVAGVRLIAAWQEDTRLAQALDALPDVLERAATCSWQPALDALADADRMFVIGRGTGLAIAAETALKLKEVCGLQAEAFSGAEVRHGPMALVESGFPMLVLAPRGPAQQGLIELAADMRRRGARVLLAAPPDIAHAELTLATTATEDLDPIAALQSVYVMVEALARLRGLDPDQPRHLAKVTRTR